MAYLTGMHLAISDLRSCTNNTFALPIVHEFRTSGRHVTGMRPCNKEAQSILRKGQSQLRSFCYQFTF